MAELEKVRAEADLLVKRGRELDDAASLAVYDSVVERFGESPRVDVQERVAMALLEKALALFRLGRSDDELQVYDELLRRFGSTDDPRTLERVAWALYDKAYALENLGQGVRASAAYRELVERFENSGDAAVRPRVSFALWQLYTLGEGDETLTFRALVERGDDEIEPALREYVLFALCMLGDAEGRRGDWQAALAIYEEAISRAGDSDDAGVRLQLGNVLRQKAFTLDHLGRYREAIAVCDELLLLLEADAQTPLAIDVARRRAVALDEIGRFDEALAAYDDLLAQLSDTTDTELSQHRVRLLASKAKTLWRLKRRQEALVVTENLLQRYQQIGDHAAADELRPVAVRSLFEKVELLCELDRSDEAAEVVTRTAELLGDTTTAAASTSPRPSDDEIAALLASIHAGDCWHTFETPPPDTREKYDALALTLYRQTDPLLASPVEDWHSPARAAAMLIRQVADGYALLSQLPATTGALPQHYVFEWAIRIAGIDEWAADHGYPLKLTEASEDIRDIHDDHTEQPDLADDCAVSCVTAFYKLDILHQLISSATGRDALQHPTHRWLATHNLHTARYWGGWAFLHGDDAQPATAAAVLIAQAYYCATHEPHPAELTPSHDTIRELLHNADGLQWLDARDLTLPAWLQDTRT